ncbi:hypothetical protein PR003_g30934 [Phytophthora rubi]|uniref:Secreted protein n=1 Tax=Phytophthora rubi TaxID=129364 RepID=A0A6A3GYQ6_9STRA|nr:hypothetical protein PR002_g30067 [Phytophthora rubi]KAE8962127.1 hypothetical protein PR001_g29812 [Phytophthora rubi]KAE9270111.1 hypothetical protein PR003_g30934 [Phytophthora rubi]
MIPYRLWKTGFLLLISRNPTFTIALTVHIAGGPKHSFGLSIASPTRQWRSGVAPLKWLCLVHGVALEPTCVTHNIYSDGRLGEPPDNIILGGVRVVIGHRPLRQSDNVLT